MNDGLGVSAAVVRAVVHGAYRRGVDLTRSLKRLDVAPEALEDDEARLPLGLDIRLLNDAALIGGDDDFGLHLAEDTPLGAHGLFEYILATSDNVRDMLDKGVRSSRLVSDVDWLELIEAPSGGLALIRRYNVRVTEPQRQTAEYVLALLLLRVRLLTGVDWAPAAVQFEHPRPARTEEHQRIFRTTPVFDAAWTALTFDRLILEAPVRRADPMLTRLIDGFAERALARLRSDDLVARVRRTLTVAMHGTLPSLTEVASKLGMASRTLQRRLRDQGTSWSAVVRSTRHELALEYLAGTTLPIAEVAFALGYASVANFYHAFRDWTGMTPAEYRRARKHKPEGA